MVVLIGCAAVSRVGAIHNCGGSRYVTRYALSFVLLVRVQLNVCVVERESIEVLKLHGASFAVTGAESLTHVLVCVFVLLVAGSAVLCLWIAIGSVECRNVVRPTDLSTFAGQREYTGVPRSPKSSAQCSIFRL